MDYNYLSSQDENTASLFSLDDDISTIYDVYDVYDVYDPEERDKVVTYEVMLTPYKKMLEDVQNVYGDNFLTLNDLANYFESAIIGGDSEGITYDKIICPTKGQIIKDSDKYWWGIKATDDSNYNDFMDKIYQIIGYNIYYTYNPYDNYLTIPTSSYNSLTDYVTGIAIPLSNLVQTTDRFRFFKNLKMNVSLLMNIEGSHDIKYVDLSWFDNNATSWTNELTYTKLTSKETQTTSVDFLLTDDLKLQCFMYFYNEDYEMLELNDYIDISSITESFKVYKKDNPTVTALNLSFNKNNIINCLECSMTIPKSWAPTCELNVDFQFNLNIPSSNKRSFQVVWDESYYEELVNELLDNVCIFEAYIMGYDSTQGEQFCYLVKEDGSAYEQSENIKINDKGVLELDGDGIIDNNRVSAYIYVPLTYNDNVFYFNVGKFGDCFYGEENFVEVDFQKPIITTFNGVIQKQQTYSYFIFNNEFGTLNDTNATTTITLTNCILTLKMTMTKVGTRGTTGGIELYPNIDDTSYINAITFKIASIANGGILNFYLASSDAAPCSIQKIKYKYS